MATHSNGISALQLQKQLGIGSYRSAWLLAHKLRASMVDPERNPLSGLVEIGSIGPKTIFGQPRRQDHGGSQWASPPTTSDFPIGPRRWASRRSPRVDPPSLLQPQRMGAIGLHGLRRKHLQAYLDEFVFRFNAAKPATLLSARSSASPCRTPYLQHVDRTEFFNTGTWAGGTWRRNTILTRGDNVQAAMGSNSVEWNPADTGNCPKTTDPQGALLGSKAH